MAGAVALAIAAPIAKVRAASTWTGGATGAGSLNWSSAGNWSGGTPTPSATTDVTFAGTTNLGTSVNPLNQDIGNPMKIGSITFASGAGAFFLGGNGFDVNDGNFTITQASSSAQSIANTIVHTGDTNSVRTLTLTGGGTGVTTLSGIISDSNGNRKITVIKSGSSTFVLAAANTFDNGISITGGTLIAQNASALGDVATSTLTISGSSFLDLATNSSINAYNTIISGTSTIVSDRATSGAGITHTLGTLSIGAFTLNITRGTNATGSASVTFGATTVSASGAVFDTAANTTLTLGALATNANGFTKQNSGQLNLNSASLRTGAATLSAGTMKLGSTSALGTTAAALNLNGGVLDLATDTTVNAYNTTVGASATIASDRATSGAGITHTLGTLNIGAFTLNITQGTNATGSASVTFGATTVSASGAVFDTAANTTLTLGALATNANSFTKQNSGQLNLNSASSRTGVVTLTGGTMKLGSTSALGTTAAALNLNGGVLDLATDTTVNAYNTTVGGTTTIASDRATSGAGITHTLGTLSMGAFTLGITKGSNATGSASVAFGATTLTGNAAFDTAATTTLMLGSVSGAFTVTKQNSGALILAGSNGSTTTTISGGTLQIGAGTTTGSLGTGNVTNNANLTFKRSDSITVSNVISGSGSLTQAGSGSVTLSGNNDYSGVTSVNSGQLNIDGTLTSGGLVTVNSGGRLAGTSTSLGRAVSVASGGKVSPGRFQSAFGANDGMGQLTSSANFTLASGATMQVELGGDGSGIGTPGTNFDQIAMSGSSISFTTGGATLVVIPLPNAVIGTAYPIVTTAGGATVNFSSFFAGLTNGQEFNAGGGVKYKVDATSTEIDVTFTSVPEPGSVGIVAVVGTMLLGKRRRSNRKGNGV